MSSLRGGNSAYMECVGICANLNGFPTPCAGKQQGDPCVLCSGSTYNYTTQRITPTPSGCNTNTTGYQNDPKNNQQGCGYYYTDSKCQMVGGALMCQGQQVGTGGCMGSVVVSAQPGGS